MSKLINGLYAAALTPFNSDESINEGAFRALLKHNIEQGLDGVYLNGSTGECFLMSIDERKKALEIAADTLKGEGQIICHIGAIGSGLSLDLARHAEECGAAAVSSIPPFYYKFSKQEILDYFSSIADAVSIPVIPYNFPALSGVAITPEDILNLKKRNDNIAGIKFTSKDLEHINSLRRKLPDFSIYNGFDEVFAGGLAMGASGAIGSTFNIIGSIYVRILELHRQDRMREASLEQNRANSFIEELLGYPLLPALKYLMFLRGLDCGLCRKPFRVLRDEEKRGLEELYRNHIETL